MFNLILKLRAITAQLRFYPIAPQIPVGYTELVAKSVMCSIIAHSPGPNNRGQLPPERVS
jgi:hypothetical protein